MAKRKIQRYSFNATAKTIKVPGNIRVDQLLMVINSVDGIIIANQLDPGKGFTRSYDASTTDVDLPNSLDGVTTFTLEYDTQAMSNTDELTIYLDDERNGLKIRPYDFGTDSIERMRVANPQSLIDADFEYGLQNTKWQNIGLNRNIPSFYEVPGPPFNLTTGVTVPTSDTSTYTTVTVNVDPGTGLTAGTPFSVFGLDNTLAEGLFVALTDNSPTFSQFTYLAKGNINTTSTTLSNSYTVVKEGAVFTGASLNVSSIVSSTNSGIVTVTTSADHGLVPGSPIYVVDSTAGTQRHEGSFFTKQVLTGTQFTYDAEQNIISSITLGNVSIYARNDSGFIHRPFDGGVIITPTIPIHGLEAKRQTKRYFRYQSGKGFFFSTGTLFNPIFDIQSATYSNPDITVTTQIPHGLQVGCTVRLYGITSSNYNGDFLVKTIVNGTSFRVAAASAPTDSTAVLDQQPRVAVINWSGACVRAGMFDDTNGIFWEYDGQKLYAVKRSSTFQLAGTISFTAGSQTVTGSNTRFSDQLKVGNYIQIKGQRYLVTSISSNTTLTVNPENRGVSVTGAKPTIIREVRVPQEDFNCDTMDGFGPSGYNINLAKMQMMALQYSWYGAGFIDFMCRGPSGEFIIAHRMSQNNINDEAYMRSGNLPARYEVVNESAVDKLAVASTLSGNLTLSDASRFPASSATYPSYVMLSSNQVGTNYHEVISYTGKSGNVLTGVTRATSYTQFLAGASRTFQGSATDYNHPVGSSAILLNTTCAPTISHWGSAVIMDGGFDNDTGYLFNIANFSISIAGNSTETILLFRPAPSISNTIAGSIGQREIINRSIIQPLELEVQADRTLEISGVLNPSNVNAVTWTSASTQTIGGSGLLSSVYQPSFAQYVSNADFSTPAVDGEIIFRYITPNSRATKSVFDLTKVKAIENSILGGDKTYPDGPEVIAIVVGNKEAQVATIDFSFKWTEAQA